MAKFIVEGIGEFPWDPDRLSVIEAIALEKATGAKVNEIAADFNGYNSPSNTRGALGLGAFLWLAMQRNNHIIPFAKLAEVDVSDIQIVWDDEPEAEPADPPVAPPAAKPSSGSARKTGSSRRKSPSTESGSGRP